MATTTVMTSKPVILVMEGLSGSGQCVTSAGGIPRRCSPTGLDAAFEILDKRDFDGLLLTGGGDVNPHLYNRKPHAKVYGVSDERDYTEMYALEVARDMGIPVLGICRGSQIMTVEAGGDLRQHIGGHYGSHPVLVDQGSALLRATGGIQRPIVRSLHHQEVRHVAPGWKISGYAPDGTAEAVETDDGRCLGVQFHPEMDQGQQYARNIFRWLIEESAARAGMPTPALPAPPKASKQKRKTAAARKATGPRRLPASITWFCPFEGIRFDRQEDQQDHLRWIHGVTVDDETGKIVTNGHTMR